MVGSESRKRGPFSLDCEIMLVIFSETVQSSSELGQSKSCPSKENTLHQRLFALSRGNTCCHHNECEHRSNDVRQLPHCRGKGDALIF